MKTSAKSFLASKKRRSQDLTFSDRDFSPRQNFFFTWNFLLKSFALLDCRTKKIQHNLPRQVGNSQMRIAAKIAAHCVDRNIILKSKSTNIIVPANKEKKKVPKMGMPENLFSTKCRNFQVLLLKN